MVNGYQLVIPAGCPDNHQFAPKKQQEHGHITSITTINHHFFATLRHLGSFRVSLPDFWFPPKMIIHRRGFRPFVEKTAYWPVGWTTCRLCAKAMGLNVFVTGPISGQLGCHQTKNHLLWHLWTKTEINILGLNGKPQVVETSPVFAMESAKELKELETRKKREEPSS